MIIHPECDMNRWETSNSCPSFNDYYTKKQVDEIVDEIDGMTESEVKQLIDNTVNPISQQVRQNTLDILNRYTKEETNALLSVYKTKLESNKDIAEYAAINGNVLTLNNKNITV